MQTNAWVIILLLGKGAEFYWGEEVSLAARHDDVVVKRTSACQRWMHDDDRIDLLGICNGVRSSMKRLKPPDKSMKVGGV